MVALDFMENLIEQNRKANGHHGNIDFRCALRRQLGSHVSGRCGGRACLDGLGASRAEPPRGGAGCSAALASAGEPRVPGGAVHALPAAWVRPWAGAALHARRVRCALHKLMWRACCAGVGTPWS